MYKSNPTNRTGDLTTGAVSVTCFLEGVPRVVALHTIWYKRLRGVFPRSSGLPVKFNVFLGHPQQAEYFLA